MNYAVAIYDTSKGENYLYIVDGSTSSEAIKEAIIQNCDEEFRNEEFLAWVKSLGNNDTQVIANASESDLIVSNIEEL